MVNSGKSAYTRSSESGYIIGPTETINQNFKFQKNKNGKNLCSIPRSCYDRRVSKTFYIDFRDQWTAESAYELYAATAQDPCYRVPFWVTKITHISASTSTLKSPLSPRPNLMPFPSRETASATKLLVKNLQSYIIDQYIFLLLTNNWFIDHTVHLFWQHFCFEK